MRGGQNYATPNFGRATALDVAKPDSLEWSIRSVRPGFWIIVHKENGVFRPWGSESSNLDYLKDIVRKKNAQVRSPAAKANEEIIAGLVSEQMKRTGGTYTDCFCNIRKHRPELFFSMADPSGRQRRAMPPRK
jgi:hypothetical protein